MFTSYMYPWYRSSYFLPYSYPVWPYGTGGNYYGSNVIGSAVANQSSNQIGGIGNFSSQVATPTVI